MSFNPLEYQYCLKEPRFLSDVQSWQEHIPFAFAVMQMLRPRIFVELGTHKGDSYLAFCQAVESLNLSTTCYAVDTWEGDGQAGYYENKIYDELKTYHDKLYARFSSLRRCYFDDAVCYFSDGSIDLLHIDGLHTYDAVKHDFECWLPKLSDRGIILFHDTNVRERDFGVWRLLGELSSKYPSFEFKHGHGLGVIAVGKIIPEPLKCFFNKEQVPQHISEFFHFLGSRISLTQMVKSQSGQLSDQGQQIADLAQELAARDRLIFEQEQLIAAKDQETNELHASLAEHGRYIAELNQQIESLKHQAIENSRRLAETNLILIEKNKKLAETEHHTSEYNQQLVDANQQLNEANQQLNERSRQLGEVNHALAELNYVLVEKDARIEALLQSLSWKITAPLRMVFSVLILISTYTLRRWLRSFQRISRFVKFAADQTNAYYADHGRLPRLSELATRVKCTTATFLNNEEVEQIDYSGLKATDLTENADSTTSLESAPSTNSLSSMDLYDAWMGVNQWNAKREELLQQRLKQLPASPLLSIILPVYNPPVECLNRAIASVCFQVYANWELCIADDASTNGEIKNCLEGWAQNDARIKIHYRQSNGNISLATNSAASIATGSHLVFLDHDDELSPDALAEIALYIAAHPEADIIYSDDDKIDVNGKRFAPQFKPDWSPELLLSYMYFSHVFVVRRILFDEVGGTRTGYEGSQDYDLALRISEKAKHIGHIPLILYHWRVIEGSTAASGNAKPASIDAGRNAVQGALDRRGIQAIAYQPDWAKEAGVGIFSHKFNFDDLPSVSIIVPTKDHVKILKRCVDSILSKTEYPNYEILIVDNDSVDPSTFKYLETICKRPNVSNIKVSCPEGRFNFSYINNRAVESVHSEYVLFLNNDTEVINKEWLKQMVGYAQMDAVGAVGARLLYPDRRIQHAGVLRKFYRGLAGHAFIRHSEWSLGYLGYPRVLRNYSAVTAACLITPRTLFLEMDGFDEHYFKVAYNDVDYCGRLLDKGLRVVYTPEAELFHHEGFSRGFTDDPQEGAAFREKYCNHKDRYYNPSLSLNNENFEIWPRCVSTGELKKPVRTLMCSHNLNHEGAPHCLYEIAVWLKNVNLIEPLIFSPTDGPLRALYESQGIRVIIDEGLGYVFETLHYKARVQVFTEFIKNLDVDLVFCNTIINFYAVEAAKGACIPSIWNIHESEPWQHYQNWWGAELAETASRCFAYPYKVIFVAHTTKALYHSFEWKHNFHVIHNGLNLQRIYQEADKYDRDVVREQLGILDDELAILLPGTICERKGQHDLALALQSISKSTLQRIRCFIVGETKVPVPYSRKLRSIVDDLPEEIKNQISILPTTSEIFKFYKAADIFVCTSRIESFPLVILEAMAFKLPIITTPVFGIQEQVQENINALYYAPGDHVALAEALNCLVINDDLRKRFSSNSLPVLRQLGTLDDMMGSYAAAFKEGYLSAGPLPLMSEGIKVFRSSTNTKVSIGKVTFVTTYRDANSQRFRVYNIIEGLSTLGVECRVIKDDFEGNVSSLLDSDLVIFFRVGFSQNVKRIIQELKKSKIPTVFDVDDLVFEPDSAVFIHALSSLTEGDREDAIAGFTKLHETLLLCDFATCTTPALQKRIELLGKICHVIPNSINSAQLKLAQQVVEKGKSNEDGKVKIGYFSGTKTHERDFLEVSDALFDVMEKYPQVEFHLVGVLDLDDKFMRFGERVVKQPLMEYLDMLSYLAKMDLNIAPLEMGNLFTACKSELKIFEAALLGITTVASATGSYGECINDGLTGFTAASKKEWVEKLEMLVSNKNLRLQVAERAKEDLTNKFRIESVIQVAVNVYAEFATRPHIDVTSHEQCEGRGKSSYNQSSMEAGI